ncbi:Protein YdjA [Mycetocola reblochoni REB411]|uniref:Putative NAD(P)H nitroreductase n=1 Tax=Mycetocola reblochoni REB411 TaxID=1255698 RepID=A0A1R4KDV1_9MICO|nr:Protein YdjA [Mycetocola reblochoni REB411]
MRDALLARRSSSSVGDEAPDSTELAELVRAASRVADHSSLRPWRVIEVRGRARDRLGAALAEAAGDDSPSRKPLRSPLLLAVVVCLRPSKKVPEWEQEATAAGVAHALSLLLDEAGWSVLWRTGPHTRSTPVARVHDLGENERLLGWLYVGRPGASHATRSPKRPVDAAEVLSSLPEDEP